MKKESIFSLLIALGFCVLLVKYFSIQVRHGEEFEQLAMKNHLRYISIPAPRGTIWSAEVRETPRFRSGSRSFQMRRWSARSGQAG